MTLRAGERNAAWQKLIFSTEPVDRERMNNHVRTIYAALEEREPSIFWCDSPFQTFAIAHLLDRFADPQSADQNFARFWDQCEEQYLRYLPASLVDKVNLGTLQNRLSKHFPIGSGYDPCGRAIGIFDRLCSRIFKLLEEVGFTWQRQYWRGTGEGVIEPCLLFNRQLLRDLNAALVVQELHVARATQRRVDLTDALAVERAVAMHMRFFLDTGNYFEEGVNPHGFDTHTEWQSRCRLSDLNLLLDLLQCRSEVTEACAAALELGQTLWWVAGFDGCVLLSDRPKSILRDEQGLLHSDTGAAIEFADGYGQFFWHGAATPAYAVLANPTVEIIETEGNIELRRIMLERFGTQEFLFASGAKVFHVDETGTLYRKEMRGEEAIMMVHVVNATPEPDGNFHDFFLRVPPWMQTAREAIAWTFGLSADEYDPQQET